MCFCPTAHRRGWQRSSVTDCNVTGLSPLAHFLLSSEVLTTKCSNRHLPMVTVTRPQRDRKESQPWRSDPRDPEQWPGCEVGPLRSVSRRPVAISRRGSQAGVETGTCYTSTGIRVIESASSLFPFRTCPKLTRSHSPQQL